MGDGLVSSRYEAQAIAPGRGITVYSPWADIERDHVPAAVQELLDPVEVRHVTIAAQDNLAHSYRRKKP